MFINNRCILSIFCLNTVQSLNNTGLILFILDYTSTTLGYKTSTYFRHIEKKVFNFSIMRAAFLQYVYKHWVLVKYFLSYRLHKVYMYKMQLHPKHDRQRWGATIPAFQVGATGKNYFFKILTNFVSDKLQEYKFIWPIKGSWGASTAQYM